MADNSTTQSRQLTGIVTSNKMNKTIVVKVESARRHPKYLKTYTRSKKYQAHDEQGEYQPGDKVIIQECRPLSKNKRWTVVKIV